jgi:hypothetical protein
MRRVAYVRNPRRNSLQLQRLQRCDVEKAQEVHAAYTVRPGSRAFSTVTGRAVATTHRPRCMHAVTMEATACRALQLAMLSGQLLS